MRIVEGKALRLRLRRPERVLDVIPKSAVLQRNGKAADVLVHWDLESATVLKNLGFKNVPSPIVKQYDWPGIYTPMQHQIVTASFLTLNKRAYCFNEQGTSKTASAAWAADYLMSQGVIKRVLVICPMSIMQSAWQGDLFKTVMHRSVGIAHGSKATRLKVLESDPDFTIINPDGVRTIVKELRDKNYDLVIIDEATSVKNPSTDRWTQINSLITPSTWLWMLTGTPAAQSPIDAFGLARMMNKDTAPRTLYTWRDKVMFKVSRFRWIPKDGWKDKVFELLQPAVRFTKAQCLDLPPKTYTTRRVEMTRQQKRAYETLRKHLAMIAEGERVTASNAAVGLSKLLQVSSGCAYTDDGNTIEFDISNRYNELKSVIDEASNKVLVFVPYTNTIDRLVEMLNNDGYPTDFIDGRVNPNKRSRIIEKFQTQDEPRVLILQPAAIAHGVTLHAADTSVWWGPVMSLETYLQANDRMHRQGQQNPCLIIHLEGSPAERARYRMLENLSDDQNSLLEMYRDILTT